MRNRFSARLVPAALAIITAAVLATACGSSTSTGPTGSSLAGTWNLSTVNGNNLPAIFLIATPDTGWITQGSVVLTSSTWNFTATADVSAGGIHTTQSQADSGTYTVSGNTLSMTSAGDTSVTTATVNGSTITVSGVDFGTGTGAITLVFQKQ